MLLRKRNAGVGLFVVIFVSGLVGGCASKMDVNSQYNDEASFTDYKTYKWMYDTENVTGDTGMGASDVDQHIRGAVDTELAGKGFQKASSETPDFLILYHAAVKERLTSTKVNNTYSGYGFYGYDSLGSQRGGVYEYKEGTLLIDILDAKTKKISWRGSVQTELNVGKPEEKRVERLNDAIRRVLGTFPPEK